MDLEWGCNTVFRDWPEYGVAFGSTGCEIITVWMHFKTCKLFPTIFQRTDFINLLKTLISITEEPPSSILLSNNRKWRNRMLYTANEFSFLPKQFLDVFRVAYVAAPESSCFISRSCKTSYLIVMLAIQHSHTGNPLLMAFKTSNDLFRSKTWQILTIKPTLVF